MKIAFRMDDITPDMDWKSFEAFEQLFERYGCYPLLGIVPDNLDPKLSVDPAREAFWKKMQELQEKGWTRYPPHPALYLQYWKRSPGFHRSSG